MFDNPFNHFLSVNIDVIDLFSGSPDYDSLLINDLLHKRLRFGYQSQI
jgi:hypothetical protein